MPAISELLDELGVGKVAVVGSSMGGWAALELARAKRAKAVLALAPAGLWTRHPWRTDVRILSGQLAGRIAPHAAMRRALSKSRSRRRALRNISVDASRIPAEWAIQSANDALGAPGWWSHYRSARRTRFTDGNDIDKDVPVRIIFGEHDRIAPPDTSRHTDQLPNHAHIETWPGCGHMLIWDATEAVTKAILELP